MEDKIEPEKNELGVWDKKIRDADNMIANQCGNWEGYYKLFRGTTASDEDDKELRADMHVPIVGPMVHTFSARELMAFFGHSESISLKVGGVGDEDLMRELERRAQKAIHFTWSEPQVFTPLFNAITDKNTLGNVAAKIMPAYDVKGKFDSTRIFETEVIDLLNFLFDPKANSFTKAEWAGHRKVVSLQYLESRYGDEPAFKKIKDQLMEEGKSVQDTHLPAEERKGVELIEIWDRVNTKVYIFINRRYKIKQFDNFPYDFPYIMGSCFPESNTPWAYGIPDVLMWIQLAADEFMNLRIDDLVRNVHTRWLVPNNLYKAFLESGPGNLIPTNDMNQKPEALSGQDVTQSLGMEVNMLKQSAYSAMGISPWTQMDIPSKRMTAPEVMLTDKGSGRLWTVIKNSESTFWLPWAEKVLSLIINFAPDDFFDKTSGVINMADTPDKYEKFGRLTPKSLKKYHPQIQARMSNDILQEAEKMIGIAQFLRIAGSISPYYLKTGYALRLLGETFDIDGIDKIIKSDEEVEAEKKAMMKQMAQQQAMMAQQQGAQTLGYGDSMRKLLGGG